jgi:hypothetical protein
MQWCVVRVSASTVRVLGQILRVVLYHSRSVWLRTGWILKVRSLPRDEPSTCPAPVCDRLIPIRNHLRPPMPHSDSVFIVLVVTPSPASGLHLRGLRSLLPPLAGGLGRCGSYERSPKHTPQRSHHPEEVLGWPRFGRWGRTTPFEKIDVDIGDGMVTKTTSEFPEELLESCQRTSNTTNTQRKPAPLA